MSSIPLIATEGERIVAKTKFMVWLSGLGNSFRSVTFDQQLKEIEIESYTWWFLSKHQLISFNQIVALTYGYSEYQPVLESSDIRENYRVGIRLLNDEEVVIWDFFGRPYPYDLEAISKRFVKMLAEYLCVEIIPARSPNW
jgi:hypothetical protein